MEDKLIAYLKAYKKATISLNDLERIFSGDTAYQDFATEVLKLEDKGILKEVKKHKRNNKPLSLANTYRIDHAYLKDNLIDTIQKFQLNAHNKIDVQAYLSLNEKEWNSDYPYIRKIDEFLKNDPDLSIEATSYERSYQIFGDEKWIDEQGGKKIIDRLNLWDFLKINNYPDPLMLAINPSQFSDSIHKHLIVENKTTYYALLEELNHSTYTSLIYGAGWKIVASISSLERQLSLVDKEHQLFYFGDLDYEGISIWNSLNDRVPATLAIDFYKALLRKSFTTGKTNQQRNDKALNNFMQHFTITEQEQITNLFDKEGYYPQEALAKRELLELLASVNMSRNTEEVE